MKKTSRIISYIFLFIILGIIALISFSENPIKEYIKSEWLGKSTENKIEKGIKIDLNQLDSIINTNPNAIFDIFTFYCGPCKLAVEEGSDFDSFSNKKRFYISIDNRTTIDKLDVLFQKNNAISNYFYIEDKNLNGGHFNRSEIIFKRYFPNSKENIGFPFYFYSNKIGKIDSFSIGYARKNK